MSAPGLLRTLLRTSSSAPANQSPESPSPRISTSPSFSDFSCNVEADFDDVDQTSICTATPRSFDGRASMESMMSESNTPSPFGRRSTDASSLRAEMRGLLFGSKGSPGQNDLRRASISIPAAAQKKAGNAAKQAKNEAASASEKARRSQKIDGLEFYEWAELIRSSSL